jgi:hypothetical protein
MNLLTSLHSIFQHEESLRQEEGVKATRLEEVEATRLEEEDLDETEDRTLRRRRRRGTRTVWGYATRGWG